MTCVLALLTAMSVSATTIVMPSDEQLVAKTPLIVEGDVTSSTPVLQNGDREIWTETVITVQRTLKGSASQSVTVREVGGVLGDRITKVYGGPEYRQGEHVLAFLTPSPRGDYQTVDLFVGKFTEERTLAGQLLWAVLLDHWDDTIDNRLGCRNQRLRITDCLDSSHHEVRSQHGPRDSAQQRHRLFLP